MTKLHTRRTIPNLGEVLRALRTSTHTSQQLLAVRAGTTTGIIVQAERHNLASVATLNKLSRALGVSVDALVGRPT